jgi:hypothetical protein
MCKHFKYLTKNKNGFLVYCGKSAAYQLSYKNLNFNLTSEELEGLVRYLKNIDCDYWEREYENSIYEKKIPIPTLQSNLIILLERYEVFELLILLDVKKPKEYLSLSDIDYPIHLN